MILLLGSTGYLGGAFAQALRRRGEEFAALSRKQADYTRFDVLLALLKKHRATFLINAAGHAGRPNVDACETERAETLSGNALLPATIAHACAVAEIPWGHISSGCIYNGAKIVEHGETRMETDLTRPEVRKLIETNPSAVRGFTETDQPNFTFRHPPCSFYSGSKALAEEHLAGFQNVYVWRPRIPFDQFYNARNYLTKLQCYLKVYDNVNSLSHRADFARACLEMRERKAPFGIYNMTNPGHVTTRQVIGMMQRILKPWREFEFWSGDEEFYREGATALRSNCVLDTAKLLAAGIRMRPVEAALTDALENWTLENDEGWVITAT